MLEVGKNFGSYQVIRLLGKGGMGAVYQLQDKRGRIVAAKILDPEATNDPESRARFLREAQIAQKLKSPSIIKTFDIGEDPDTNLCYILMEYVGGGNLHDLIRSRGVLTVEEALEYTRNIAQVLEKVRVSGVVHRDIKPDNIMFTVDGQIKLADLGIARLVTSKTTTITKSGIVMGTPAYMSPEQMIDSHRVDTRSDIYSLGIILFEMLVGKRPHHNATLMELVSKAVQGEQIPDIRTLNPNIPSGVARLIAKMCHNNLSRRFSTPGEVVTEIETLQGKKKKSRKAIVFGLKFKRKPLMFLTAVAVVVFVGGIIAFSDLLSSKDDSDYFSTSPTIEEKPEVEEIYSLATMQDVEEPREEDIVEVHEEDENAVIAENVISESDVPESTPPVEASVNDPEDKYLAYTTIDGQKVYVAKANGSSFYYVLNKEGEAILHRPCKDDPNLSLRAITANYPYRCKIPSSLNGHTLVRLEHDSLVGFDALYIELPETIREIGKGAFKRCKYLLSIDLNKASGFDLKAIDGDSLYDWFEIKVNEDNPDLKLIGDFLVRKSDNQLIWINLKKNTKQLVVPEEVSNLKFNHKAFGRINQRGMYLHKPSLIVSDSARHWRNITGYLITFVRFVSVVEWRALADYPQVVRSAASRIKAKTTKGDAANFYVGQLCGYDGDYRKVGSIASISKSGIFFVVGKEGDQVDFRLKGYERLRFFLPKATTPQSGMVPYLGELELRKIGSL